MVALVAGGVVVALVVMTLLYRFLRKLFYGALLLAILVGVVAFVYRVQIVHRLRPMVHKVNQLSTVKQCAVSTKSLRLKKNDYYKLHIPSAKKRGGMKLVSTVTERDKLVDSNVLVSIKGMKGFSVRGMDYGSHTCTVTRRSC